MAQNAHIEGLVREQETAVDSASPESAASEPVALEPASLQSAGPAWAGPGSVGPHPTMLPALIEPEVVREHRNLFCPSYDDCLDLVLGQRWPSWTCSRCTFFALRHEGEALLRIAGTRKSDGSELSLDL